MVQGERPNRAFFLFIKKQEVAMTNNLDTMPIWQNHENRITMLEVTITGISTKMDKVEEAIKEGNKEQKDMLNIINNRMVDEFFVKKRINLSNGWKLLFALVGGGSFLYLLVEKLIIGG
ncbi:hypothetical protein [Sporosarcina sp. FA9]|uniref:hypothetical protein n=1 Tax=Sporosarcina sp. FA9 TaxID=3413030 RepID=UPI003F654D87